MIVQYADASAGNADISENLASSAANDSEHWNV
jgi:hypothetical protein